MGASPSHRTKWNGVPRDVTSPDPREGVKCLPPRDGLVWAPALSCEIYSLYKLFFKKKVASSSVDFFFYKIQLPFWPSQSQEEQSHTCGRDSLDSFGALPSVGPGAIRTASSQSQSAVASQELYPGSSVELGPRLSVLGSENHFLLEPGTPPCQLLASGTSSHNACPRWVPAVGSDNPVEKEAKSTFGETSCLPLDRAHRRPGGGPQGRGLFHFLLSW